MEDILKLTKEILILFKTNELTNLQGMFVLKTVELSLQEELIKECMKENRGEFTHGVG